MKKQILISSIFLTFAIVGCKGDKPHINSALNEKSKGENVIYPDGFFTYNSELYYSDGARFYCTFRDWEHFYDLRGQKTKPNSMILKKESLPAGMRFIKLCNSGILTKKFYD